MDENYRFKEWDEDLSNPPSYYWNPEDLYWEPEDAANIVLIDPDLYRLIELGLIEYT